MCFSAFSLRINSIPYCNWHTGIPAYHVLIIGEELCIIYYYSPRRHNYPNDQIKYRNISIQIYVLNNIFTDYFFL